MAMVQQECSIVIPVIPKHFRYLRKLLSELMREKRFVGEIHICASSVNQASLLKLEQIVARSMFSGKIEIHSTLKRKTAGENRNYGWNKANFEIVVFLDADDSYHPKRLEFVSSVMIENRADAVVHDYYRMVPKFFFKLDPTKNFSVISTDQLFMLNRVNLENSLPNGSLYSGESNLLLPTSELNKYKVHHGHLTVRRDVSIRYTNRKLGEDGELVREILKNGYNLVFVTSKLSIYDRLNLTNVFLSIRGHTMVRFSKIYRLLFSREK
jgi:glycosyltransferase involved in cell wall biosynthesis